MNIRAIHANRRSIRALAITAALSVVAALPASAASRPDPSAVRKELEALYARSDRLTTRDDKDGLVRYMEQTLAENFVGKLPGGKTVTRDEATAEITTGNSAFLTFTGSKTRITKFTLNGNDAIVESTQRITATVPGADGKTHKIEATSAQRETWTKHGRGWRLRLGEVLTLTTRLDGKVVKPPKQ